MGAEKTNLHHGKGVRAASQLCHCAPLLFGVPPASPHLFAAKGGRKGRGHPWPHPGVGTRAEVALVSVPSLAVAGAASPSLSKPTRAVAKFLRVLLVPRWGGISKPLLIKE